MGFGIVDGSFHHSAEATVQCEIRRHLQCNVRTPEPRACGVLVECLLPEVEDRNPRNSHRKGTEENRQ